MTDLPIFFQNYIQQFQTNTGCAVNTGICNFDKSLTSSSTLFIVAVFILFAVAAFLFMRSQKDALKKILILASGILVFELFTAPMWNTAHLGKLGYLYLDLSWILTMAWTAAFMFSVLIVDKRYRKTRENKKFFYYMVPMLLFTVVLESVLVSLGIRSYAPEVYAVSIGTIINIPIEVLYYAPVMTGFVIAFYKFWSRGIPFVPSPNRFSLRNGLLLLIAIVMYELLIEPIVLNQNFPQWGYIYQDINVVRIFIWMLMIWLSTVVVDMFAKSVSYTFRFILYVSLSSLSFFQIESWLINNGYRVYAQSAVDNFTGIMTPMSKIPIEVAFAVPLYLVLVLSFVAYWRVTLDNKQ